MFATILHGLRSPQNVGSIVRTHVAMGGGPVVMVGLEQPWRFGKSTQAFSRKLERICEITFLDHDEALFAWCGERGFQPVAIEIHPDAASIVDVEWPDRPALVLGNERSGLRDEFLRECGLVMRIPQFGQVGSLNVSIAHGMVTFELQRRSGEGVSLVGSKYVEVREL